MIIMLIMASSSISFVLGMWWHGTRDKNCCKEVKKSIAEKLMAIEYECESNFSALQCLEIYENKTTVIINKLNKEVGR